MCFAVTESDISMRAVCRIMAVSVAGISDTRLLSSTAGERSGTNLAHTSALLFDLFGTPLLGEK